MSYNMKERLPLAANPAKVSEYILIDYNTGKLSWRRTDIESDVGKATQSTLSLWERVRVKVLQRSLYQLWLL